MALFFDKQNPKTESVRIDSNSIFIRSYVGEYLQFTMFTNVSQFAMKQIIVQFYLIMSIFHRELNPQLKNNRTLTLRNALRFWLAAECIYCANPAAKTAYNNGFLFLSQYR